MPNQLTQLQRIAALIDYWLIEIKTHNYESYTDINKAGEDLSRQLLNLIYEYELEDLNKIKRNFPGLDIGDQKKAMVGFQITSTNTRKKLIHTLTEVVKHGLHKVFKGGIKMLVLNGDGFRLGKAKQQPGDVLPTFDVNRDVLVHTDLMTRIKEIYETDIPRFNAILALLEKELNPFYFSHIQAMTQPSDRPTGSVLYKSMGNETESLDISTAFLEGDLAVPEFQPAAPRTELVKHLNDTLNEHAIVWLSSLPSMGKTALAVLVSKTWDYGVLWIDCRDLTPGQLVEHLLTLLLYYLEMQPGKNFGETLDLALNGLNSDVLLIINDLPDLKGSVGVTRAFAKFLRAAQSKGITVLVTSNFSPPDDVALQYDLDLEGMTVAPFEERDTTAVMLRYGATGEQADLFSGIVTRSAEGHPLLIKSGARFLQSKGWAVDDETVKAVFTGRFGDAVEKDIYRRVLETTTSENTRELLYRLSLVLGNFDRDIIAVVGSAAPRIEHPVEQASELIEVWMQETSPGQMQLSPLIRKLGNDLHEPTRKEVYNQLGLKVVDKQQISQVDAFQAVYYFIQAEQYQQAALVLHRTLTAFIGEPKLFFDWGFTIHWYTTTIPVQVPAFYRVQIRVLQIEFTINLDRDAQFLAQDLQTILSTEDPGPLGRSLGNMALFHYYGLSNPLKAFGHLATAKLEYEIADLPSEVLPKQEFDDELLNGIWYVFTHLGTREQLVEWFQVFGRIGLKVTKDDAYSNYHYRVAGLSIHRNIVIGDGIDNDNRLSVLFELIRQGIEYKVPLLSAYALKNIVQYLASVNRDLKAAEQVVQEYQEVWRIDPLFQFLVFAELADQFYRAGANDIAKKYLKEIEGIAVPKIYTEAADYLILQTQVSYPESPAQSADYSRRALDLVLEGDYLLEDKIKLYGEAAIGQTLLGNLKEALDLYASGYLLLLNHFVNTEEQQALIIRYGSSINYLSQILETGTAPDYGNGKFVIPEPGQFYKTNEALLAGGFYFDERRFFGATMLEKGYEAQRDLDNAKFWAYRSIELTMNMEKLQYGIMMLKMVYYPVNDRRYRQAYALLQYLEVWLRERKKVEEQDGKNPNLVAMFQSIKESDVTLYHLLLIPATFGVSLDILNDHVREEQFPQIIADIFNNESYVMQEPEAFDFARSLYENILIKRMEYPAIEALFEKYKGTQVEALRVIAYLLLATFAGAKIAVGLQVSILGPLDASIRPLSSAYRFGMVPYIVQFWHRMVELKSKEFETVNHLRSAGWALVDRTPWDKQVGKVFKVICNHLDVTPPPLAQDVIDRADT